jgi:hypothetical protein
VVPPKVISPREEGGFGGEGDDGIGDNGIGGYLDGRERSRRGIQAGEGDLAEKFASLGAIFRNIHPGDRIFIGTGCGEPQHLLKALVDYVKVTPRPSSRRR